MVLSFFRRLLLKSDIDSNFSEQNRANELIEMLVKQTPRQTVILTYFLLSETPTEISQFVSKLYLLLDLQ